jgi:hypothetical protein
MAAKGHEDQFPSTRLSAGYGFRKETIAGGGRNERDAPTVDIPEPLAAGLNKELGSG